MVQRFTPCPSGAIGDTKHEKDWIRNLSKMIINSVHVELFHGNWRFLTWRWTSSSYDAMKLIYRYSKLLKRNITHLARHTQIAGPPGDIKMIYYVRHLFYRPSMSVEAYNEVKNSNSCALQWTKVSNRATDLRLFPTTKPLISVSIDIAGTII